MYRKTIAALTAFIIGMMMVVGFTPAATATGEGTSADNPILVAEPGDVPEGAVEDEVSTYLTPDNECDTTRSWVLTVPGQDEVSHQEYRFNKVIPGEHHDAVTHEEYRYERTVDTFKTEYHFAKFTRERTRTYTEGTEQIAHWWNWSPNNTRGPQDYVPAFPTDPRGTWQGPHVNGGPMQDTFGTFQTGGGNSPFFHRVLISEATDGGYGEWSEYGEWTKWTPETHESWEDSPAPLGVPQFHSEQYVGNTHIQRQWQAQHDGETRQVKTGTTTEDSGWVTEKPAGDGWTLVETNTVTDEEAYTDPDVTVYYTGKPGGSENESDAVWVKYTPTGGWTQFDERKVVDSEATPTVVTYYAWSDGVVCEEPEVEEPEVLTPSVSIDAVCEPVPAWELNISTGEGYSNSEPVATDLGYNVTFTINEGVNATFENGLKEDTLRVLVPSSLPNCDTDNPEPPKPEEPKTPDEPKHDEPKTSDEPKTPVVDNPNKPVVNTPAVPTAVDAGLASVDTVAKGKKSKSDFDFEFPDLPTWVWVLIVLALLVGVILFFVNN